MNGDVGTPGRRAVDAVAAAGYRVAGGDYERSRPGYPSAAIDLLVAELALDDGRTVLELAAGTGKLTRLMVGAGARVVAVEPVPAMRRHLAVAVPSVPVVAAVAEAVPLAQHSVGAVVVATAFHWFDADAALIEMARLLPPGGGLGLLWNNPDRNARWVAEVWGLVDEHRGDVPGNRDLRWRELFGEGGQFSPLEMRSFVHATEVTLDDLLARVSSISFIAALPPPRRGEVLDEVRRIVTSHPDLAGRSRFSLPYRTNVYWCCRPGRAP